MSKDKRFRATTRALFNEEGGEIDFRVREQAFLCTITPKMYQNRPFF